MRYVADFETTTNMEDCRVWAYAITSIDHPDQFQYGNNLDEFMLFCKLLSDTKDFVVYFHNLKFDGEFIFSWLFKKGYKWVKDRKELEKNTFCTLIDGNKTFYSIEICFNTRGKNKEKVTLLDSLKILPFSVEAIAKGFNLPISKLSIDYTAPRPKYHQLTEDEIAYIKNDVSIVALALQTLFKQSLTSMTAGSNAMNYYKVGIGRKRFKKLFPVLLYDDFLRDSYKGGFTYVPDYIAGSEIAAGIVLDVNSLYPSIMAKKPMPFGEGKYYEGQYKKDRCYPLYIQKISCQFTIKEKHIPTIQMKMNPRFVATEYLKESGDIAEIMTLTSVDLQLFLDHYDVYNLEYIEGYKFKASSSLFADFVDHWTIEKIKAKQEGNKAIYTLSKLMLNSLYGKFSTNPNIQSSFPYAAEDGTVFYALSEPETREPVYIPVGAFVTSYAREKTIRSAQLLYDRFLYADTDSLHLIGETLPSELEIDSSKLGAWDHEFTFSKAKFLRQKCYVEYGKEQHEESEYYKVVVAGMPSSIHKYINFDNFNIGTKFLPRISEQQQDNEDTIYLDIADAKITPRHVPGGIVLTPVDFTIKKG